MVTEPRRTVVPLLLSVLLALALAPSATAAPFFDWSEPLQLDSGSPSQFSGSAGIDCAGESLCVAVGGAGRLLVSTDPTGGREAWEEAEVDPSPSALTAVSCPSAGFCAVADAEGNLLTSTEPSADPAAWASAAIDAGHEIVSVSCPSAGFCAAVDDAGQVLVSEEPSGGAAAWSAGTVDSEGKLRQISCASTSLCALAFNRYNVFYEPPGLLVSTDPLAGASSWTDAGLELGERGKAFGVSCPSDDFCGFAYDGGIVVSSEPAGGGATWHLTHSSSEDLPAGEEDTYLEGLGITCTSADFCLAQLTMAARRSFAPPEPKLVISSRPASPGSWTIQTMNDEWPFGLGGMVCTGPAFCATVGPGGSIATSTEPTGGSEAWDPASTGVVGPALRSVACPARSFCAATGTLGRLYTSTRPTDPGSWTSTRLGETIGAVTCSSPSWCTVAANGPAGPTVMYSTNPAAGAGAWNAVARPTGRTLTCPEPGFCAQLAGEDEVLASGDPLGGIGSWVATDMRLQDERLGPPFLRALSCPSADLCATGGESNGSVFTSADPTGGRSGWVSAGLGEADGGSLGDPNIGPDVNGIDCPQTSFCALTASGGVETTTAPLGGRGAWTFSDASGLGPISCAPDASLCVSIDRKGDAVTSRSPQDEAPEWGTAEPIYEGEGLRDVSCAADGSLCAAVSRDGEVIVGNRNLDRETPGGEEPEGEEGSLPGASPSLPAPRPCRKPKPHKAKRGPAIAPGHKVSNGGRRSKSRCARPR